MVVAVPFLINIICLWRENDNNTHTHTPREKWKHEGQYTPDQIILLVVFERLTIMCFVVILKMLNNRMEEKIKKRERSYFFKSQASPRRLLKMTLTDDKTLIISYFSITYLLLHLSTQLD